MDDAIQPPKKQGRPVEFCLPDKILTDVWYKNLVVRSGKSSPAAIARQIIPEYFDRKRDDWENHKSKRDLLGKISRLEKFPPDWFLARTERAYPGTSYWCHHPFRYLAKRAVQNHKELYSYLSTLNSTVISIIFDPSHSKRYSHRRKKLSNESFEDLMSISNFDALTACIGLMIEVELFDDDEQYVRPAKTAENIAIRLLIEPPFNRWATQLFGYLSENYFRKTHRKFWSDAVASTTPYSEIITDQFLIQLIDELELRNPDQTSSQTCIYYAQNLLTDKHVQELWNYRVSEERERIKNHTSIIDLGSAIRIYERKKHVQSILQKHNVVQITSKLVKEKQHQRSPKISPGGQLHRNTQLRGLDQIDHDAGDD